MGPCGWHFLWVPICHVPSHQFVSLHFFPSHLWRFAIWQWYGLSSFVSFFFSLPSDFIFFCSIRNQSELGSWVCQNPPFSISDWIFGWVNHQEWPHWKYCCRSYS